MKELKKHSPRLVKETGSRANGCSEMTVWVGLAERSRGKVADCTSEMGLAEWETKTRS